jgi:putative ABC transport system permease protein
MLFLQNFVTALEQLWATKVRSLLTVLGIIIAVTSTIVVVSMVQGFTTHVNRFLEGLGTNAMFVYPVTREGPPRATLTEADIESVERSCPAVSRTAPEIGGNVRLKYGNRERSQHVSGTAEEFQHIRSFYVDVGRCFGPVDIENRRSVCVLGRDVLTALEADESIVGDYVLLNGKRFRVIGLLEKKGGLFGGSLDDVLLVPYTTALDLIPEKERFVGFWAQAESANEMVAADRQITTVLRRRHRLGPGEENDFGISRQDKVIEEVNKVGSIAGFVLTGIVTISLLVGGIGIMNVMLVSVTERTREIGLRKAVGARRRDILLQFLTEAVVLSLAGGVIGIVLGYAITGLASHYPDMVDVSVPPWVVVLGVGFSVFVGVVFGILPAFKAAILRPIDALRYE